MASRREPINNHERENKMATYYHGSDSESISLHAGFCITKTEQAAESYGRHLHVIEIDMAGLVVERIYFDDAEARQRYEDNEYPCDTDAEIASYVARGVDVVVYDDYDPRGNEHITTRLISDRAIAAAVVLA